MTLLEKLRGLFSRDDIPDEAKKIFDHATTPNELLRGLDELLTRNEVEAKELNEEITKIEEKATDEEERIRAGALPERQKRNTLMHVKRLRKQMDNYEGRLRIYERNMSLHLTLIGKIQQMEAMKLGGVDESKIDQIVMDFEEKLEKYHDVMNAAEAHEGKAHVVSAREDRDLRALEQEIVGTKEATAPPAVERAGPEKEGEPARVEFEKPRRRPIEEGVNDALGEGEGTAEAAPGEKKKVELE